MKNINNNKYWKDFYSKQQKSISKPSLFAKFVFTKLENSFSLIDIGCGNGRDSMFFEKKGINVISIDSSDIPFFMGKNFVKENALTFDQDADAYYSRFFLHTIDENELVIFLSNISKKMKENSLFFIETRSTRGISKKSKEETFFKSAIGDSHYRILYSLEYLSSILSKYFKISFIEESNEFSPFENAKPYVVRSILKKKL